MYFRYPGMMRPIAKNFYNLVFIVDASRDDCKRLLSTAESFYLNDIPLRIGFVFVTNDHKETGLFVCLSFMLIIILINDSIQKIDGFKEANVALYRAHNYIVQSEGRTKALSFITDVYAKTPKASDVTSEIVVREFKKKFPKFQQHTSELDDVFGVDSDFDEGRLLTMDYYKKIG